MKKYLRVVLAALIFGATNFTAFANDLTKPCMIEASKNKLQGHERKEYIEACRNKPPTPEQVGRNIAQEIIDYRQSCFSANWRNLVDCDCSTEKFKQQRISNPSKPGLQLYGELNGQCVSERALIVSTESKTCLSFYRSATQYCSCVGERFADAYFTALRTTTSFTERYLRSLSTSANVACHQSIGTKN